MATFTEVLEAAQNGYHNRDDYPPYSFTPWEDRRVWTQYLEKINNEIEEKRLGVKEETP